MKLASFIISLLLLTLILGLYYIGTSEVILLNLNLFTINTTPGNLVLCSAILGSLFTILIFYSLGFFFRSDKKKFAKQIDDLKLRSEGESEKTKQLEAKIKTLEEALKIASGTKPSS